VTRGAAPESRADGVHYPGTYLAGGYNRLQTEIAGHVVENEDLVNLPNWQVLDFRVQEATGSRSTDVELLEYRQELDLRGGVLHRRCTFVDGEGRRTRVAQRRFVHMGDPHLAGLETTFVAENWSGRLEVRSALDGTVINDGVARYRDLDQRHLRVLEQGEVGDDIVYLQVETVQSRLRVALAARTRVGRNGAPAERSAARSRRRASSPTCSTSSWPRGAGHRREGRGAAQLADPAIAEAGLAAASGPGRSAASTSCSPPTTRVVPPVATASTSASTARPGPARSCASTMFHLLQTVSEHTIDLDVGVPARGWHGEAYRGHIFWDEMFIFPC
jgi:alpha,alpha-trehalase